MDAYKNTVISTRIRLARNIRNLPFPNRLNGEEEIYSVLLKGTQQSCDALFKNQFFQISAMDEYQKEALVERHLISKNLIESKYGCAFISEEENISVMVNEEDHLRLQAIINGFNLEAAYNSVAKIDNELKKHLDIAFDSKLGYLTSCPTNLGSAMRASVMMFLPAITITGAIETLMIQCKEIGITIRGMYGEGSKAEGYIYQLSNQAAISLSEEQILNKIKNVVDKIVKAENAARINLKNKRGIDLQNEIMISYGILKYACKMSSKELMNNLALIKLGVAIGYLDLDMDKLNNLMVLTQPAMLCFLEKKKLSYEERDIKRANITRKMLS